MASALPVVNAVLGGGIDDIYPRENADGDQGSALSDRDHRPGHVSHAAYATGSDDRTEERTERGGTCHQGDRKSVV